MNDVDFVAPGAFPITFTVYVPTGVELFVCRVSTVEQLGLQLEDENDAVTSRGSPETLNEADLEGPEVNAVLILVETADPWVVLMSPELAIVKSKLFRSAIAWVLF